MKGYRNTETGQVVEISYPLSTYRNNPEWELIDDEPPAKVTPKKKRATRAKRTE